MSRANSPAAPQGNNANQQVAGNIEGPMRRPRDENVPPPAAAAAQPPQTRQRTEGGPNWTMDSKVRDVLFQDVVLEDYEALRKTKLHEILNLHFGETLGTLNVSVEVFVKNPGKYIVDTALRVEILGLGEFKTVRTAIDLSEKVDYLIGKEISSLRQWQESGKAEIREFVGPVARGMLDAALDTAKEARERAAQPADGAELKGVYDSIYNAKWSYVMSGYDEEPLGMKVFDGRPQRIWTKEEVNVSHTPETMNEPLPRHGNLEIVVLTSQMGWPYTSFLSDIVDCDINHKRGVEHVVTSDVYIRRETLRVWYKVEEELNQWLMGEVIVNPMPHVLIGTPGIGKSFSVGSLLLYTLAMPATSTWCQGPVPRIIGGSQEPAAFLSWGTLLCSGYGIIQHRDQQRLAGTPSFICRSLGTCQRAISSISSALRCCCPVMWTSKKGLLIDIFGRVQGGRLLAPSAVFRSTAEIQQKL